MATTPWFSNWNELEPDERKNLIAEHLSPEHLCSTLDFLSKNYPDLASQRRIAQMLEGMAVTSRGNSIDGPIAAYYYHIDGGGIETALRTLAESIGGTRRSIVLTESRENAWTNDESPHPDQQLSKSCVIALSDYAGSSHFEQMKAALDEIKPYALVYHAWFDSNLLWDAVLCHALGIRFILNVHGVFSHFLEVSDGLRNPWSDGRLFASVPAVVAFCDAVVCQSNTSRSFFSHFNPHAYAIAHELPPQYKTALKRPNTPPGNADIVWVGRFDPYKHPESALDILAEVKKRIPEATLTYIGKSAGGAFEKSLREQAARLGVGESVRFAGFQANVEPYYRNAAVLLSTTEVEGYCMVLAEAAAIGLPTVAYDLPYLPFASCGGIAWVPQGDALAAARAVTRILSDDDTWSSMSARAQSFMDAEIHELMPDSWNDVIAGLEAAPTSETSKQPEDENTVWGTLLDHYLHGESKTYAQITRLENELREATAQRDELLNSNSFKVGNAILSPLRALRSLGKRR